MNNDNLNLLKDGLKLYNEYRPFIFNSYPIYPNGFINISNQNCYSFGLINDQKDEAVLAAWNLKDDANSFEIDLSKYNFNSCEIIYPIDLNNFKFEFKNSILKCSFKTQKSARLFHLKVK